MPNLRNQPGAAKVALTHGTVERAYFSFWLVHGLDDVLVTKVTLCDPLPLRCAHGNCLRRAKS